MKFQIGILIQKNKIHDHLKMKRSVDHKAAV